jgi:formylglycine-generating enzyme required for sulfatase activity
MCGVGAALWISRSDAAEDRRYERNQAQVVIANPTRLAVRLFRSGEDLASAQEVTGFGGSTIDLAPGSFFLEAEHQGSNLLYPIPVLGYRAGPEADGSLQITVRVPSERQPPVVDGGAGLRLVPSGHALIGDRNSPQEIHYAWVSGFFVAPFETTNDEFRQFLNDGYSNDANWSEEGRHWKADHHTKSSAALHSGDAEFVRFGQADQPVVNVTWYEANAYCHWLTAKLGGGIWIFSLPTDAEWEKAARGPDGFDYGLSMTISDREVPLYNWKKNPGAAVTVVGTATSRAKYVGNRYGLYHMSGNVAEWTQSVFRPYSRGNPYSDDDRNHDDAPGRRTARGGSWYSATTASLYIPYRDAFQPEYSNNDLGFRVVARLL